MSFNFSSTSLLSSLDFFTLIQTVCMRRSNKKGEIYSALSTKFLILPSHIHFWEKSTRQISSSSDDNIERQQCCLQIYASIGVCPCIDIEWCWWSQKKEFSVFSTCEFVFWFEAFSFTLNFSAFCFTSLRLFLCSVLFLQKIAINSNQVDYKSREVFCFCADIFVHLCIKFVIFTIIEF